MQRWLEWKKIINDDPQAGLNLYNRRNESCKRKWTYMDYVCRFGDYDVFVKVVQPLNKKQKLIIFKQVDNTEISPLMRLIVNNPIRWSSDMNRSLKLLFQNLSHNDKIDIMTMEDRRGWNVLAFAAAVNRLSAIEFLLNTIKFDPQQQLKLMKFSWRHESDTTSLESGYGSDEEAGVREPVSAAEVANYYKHSKESSELLDRLKADAMIRVAVEAKSTGRCSNVQEMINNCFYISIYCLKDFTWNRYCLFLFDLLSAS